MSCIWDFFGTDNFYNYYGSNAESKIDEEAAWFKNNVWNEVSTDPVANAWNMEVPVSASDTCESSTTRLGEADEWLKNNFDYYGSSDGCVVLDHYWDGTYFGCAYIGGITGTTENNKTALVDYEAATGGHLPSYDTNSIGIRHYLGMEPGHVYGARHPEDSVNTVDGFVTYMFNNEGPECEDSGDPQEVASTYSNCAESTIRDYVNNEC